MIRPMLIALLPFSILLQILSGCSSIGVVDSTPTMFENREIPTVPLAPTISGDTIEYPGCSYTWSTRELPSLTHVLQSSLANLSNEITGSAYAFGEECRQQDGTISFLPMETDFRILVNVESLNDEDSLGNCIVGVMGQIEALPPEDLSGPRPGRVEFEFYMEGAESRHLTIELTKYRAEAGGLHGASLFNHFAED